MDKYYPTNVGSVLNAMFLLKLKFSVIFFHEHLSLLRYSDLGDITAYFRYSELIFTLFHSFLHHETWNNILGLSQVICTLTSVCDMFQITPLRCCRHSEAPPRFLFQEGFTSICVSTVTRKP